MYALEKGRNSAALNSGPTLPRSQLSIRKLYTGSFKLEDDTPPTTNYNNNNYSNYSNNNRLALCRTNSRLVKPNRTLSNQLMLCRTYLHFVRPARTLSDQHALCRKVNTLTD